MSYKFKLLGVLPLTAAFSQLAAAQTATVPYATAPPAAPVPPEVIPTLGTAGLLVLGFVLVVFGAHWLRKNPGARALAASSMTAGLLMVVGSGGWLVNNAEAIVETTEYIFSEHASPVTVTSFPAVLTNDLDVEATIGSSIDVSDCPGEVEITGTCAADSVLAANGGTCSLDSVCAPVNNGQPQQCDTGLDTHTGSPWTVCESTADEAWVANGTSAGGRYNADLICQEMGYDRAGEYGGTCGNVCGYCEGTTSCESPGNKHFDNGGNQGDDGFGLVLATTVHWTCVNDPG